MSGSELWPRKVELVSAHKECNKYREYFTHSNEACKHSYKNNLTAVIYSLVNGLYKITTESIKLILDVEQFGASSDLIVPACGIQKASFSFFFFYASLLKLSMNSIEMPLSIFSLEFIMKSKTSINNSMLFALPAAQVLA